MTRARLRDLGITIGRLPPGPHNAITDVPGVWVGHVTVLQDAPCPGRTGLTVIVPREGAIWHDHAFAAYHALNGFGEMTGLAWLEESGTLCSAVALTSTLSVGSVYEAVQRYPFTHGFPDSIGLPVVAETYDGHLNGMDGARIDGGQVEQAIASARGGPVAEGNVGGGTGMICHEFKGGIGTASRLVDCPGGPFTVGVLVQANHGNRADLRVDGVPVGREIGPEQVPLPPWRAPQPAGSVIAVVATDAPLLSVQCRRLAQRATVGLARCGGLGHNRSGDIFLAFATGNHLPVQAELPHALRMVPHGQINPFFEAVVEAVEEAVLNALTAAETMTGFAGRTVHALPLDELQRVMARYRPAG